MRLLILSDLHLEWAQLALPRVETDAVVLAGDVNVGDRAIEWIADTFRDLPVLYVLGNHEYWGQDEAEVLALFRRQTLGTNIHVLENDSLTIQGVRFLGCTLWTDFALNGSSEQAQAHAAECWPDFSVIRTESGCREFSAADSARKHAHSLAWLQTMLSDKIWCPTIVVTHHAPSAKSLAPRHRGSLLGPVFASDLEQFVAECGARLWIHGHAHFCVDYALGSTRVLSNPRGHQKQPVSGFSPSLVVEL